MTVFCRVTAVGFFVAAFALMPWAGGHAQDLTGRTITGAADVDTFILKLMREYDVPGASIAIVRNGETVVLKGYGVRDQATGAAVDADTMFQLASVAKCFTALTFAAQASQGKADWEKPVREVLPDFQMMDECATKLATPKDMLVHRSGLARFEGDILERLGFDRSEIMARIRFMTPGYSFRDHPEYNNMGFFVAGEVSAKIAGKKWEDVVQELVLQPAGMTRTGLAKVMMGQEENVAKPYVRTSEGGVKEVKPTRQATLAPAGGLSSTGRDMAAFTKLLLAGGAPVVDEKNLHIMFEPVIAEEPGFTEMAPISHATGFVYSPGWGVYYYGNEKIIEKGGALAGFRTLVTLIPEKKLGIVILCNKGLTVFPEAVRAECIARTLGGPSEQWQAEILAAAKKIDAMFVTPTPPADAKPAPLKLWKYAGTFTNEMLGTWKVSYDKKAKGLYVNAGPAKLRGNLKPWNENEFLLVWENSPQNIGNDIAFTVEKGKVTGIVYEGQDKFTKKK